MCMGGCLCRPTATPRWSQRARIQFVWCMGMCEYVEYENVWESDMDMGEPLVCMGRKTCGGSESMTARYGTCGLL